MMDERAEPKPPMYVRDDAELLTLAETLHHDVSPVRRSLWVSWMDADGQVLPVVVPIDDIPELPDARMLDNLAFVVGEVLEREADGGSVMFMLERPGGDSVSDNDRCWNDLLRRATQERGVSMRGLFLATAGGVRPLTLDDTLGHDQPAA